MPSVGGSRYFVTLIDDFSRYTTVYMMKQKSEVLEKFRRFVNLVENRTGLKVERLHVENETVKQKLLVLDKGITLHHRNIQLLPIELYKVKNKLSSIQGSNNIFPLNQSLVVTRNRAAFKSRSVNSELHGKDSMSYIHSQARIQEKR